MRHLAIIILALAAGCSQSEAAEDAVREAMKDPGSTLFKDVAACGNSKSIIKGLYNGKNSYGAYEGFRPFYYDAGKLELDDLGSLSSRCLDQMSAAMKATSEGRGMENEPAAGSAAH